MERRAHSQPSRSRSPHVANGLHVASIMLNRKKEGRRRSIGSGATAQSSASTPSPPTRPLRLFSESSTLSSGTGTFHQHRTYDMSAVVGDDIGSMSISPTSRDVVVATRKGLFLIDLDNPVQLPRFLPQGGTWEVAEVQWNPHLSHSQYVVSTSSEKMLLWNLYLTGRTSIEAPLQRAHYRAVTDVNWHNIVPNLVASCALDSWIHVWDIKAPMKPAASLSPFVASAAQVKWSYFDEHLLASSHYSTVMVWDKRKGSVPLFTIKAHDAKIYGISWSRTRPNEILTCSLDATVKVWDVGCSSNSLADHKGFPSPGKESYHTTPLRVAHTRYPVSRARSLPFGDGFLTLPQRSQTVLELWSHQQGLDEPVHVFDGYPDVVREFVWRTRGSNTASLSDGTFQLITWGKDRTLRFVPVDSSITDKVGYEPKPVVEPPDEFAYDSFASISIMDAPIKPTLSAPVTVNPILNAVRARTELVAPVPLESRAASKDARQTSAGGTMSLGDAGHGPRGRRRELNQDEWAKVVAGRPTERASGSGQASPSVRSTRASSPVSIFKERERERESQSRDRDNRDTATLLAQEIVAAMDSVEPHKIETTFLDTNEKRQWVLGLTGPWGESASLYLRVFFQFPRDYPHDGHLVVSCERHPLVSLKTRAYMARQLDNRRRRKRPIEACLRFLLGLPDEGSQQPQLPPALREALIDPDSSDAEGLSDKVVVRNTQETPVLKISQAVFGPGGVLVCIFPLHHRAAGGSAAPSMRINARTRPLTFPDGPKTAGLLRALKFLRGKAIGHDSDADSQELEEDVSSLRGFGAVSPLKGPSGAAPATEFVVNTFSAPAKVRVYLKDFSDQLHHGCGLDQKLAANYILEPGDPLGLCIRNAPIARQYRRYDHERVWKTLQMVLGKTVHPRRDQSEQPPAHEILQWGQNPLARKFLDDLYNESVAKKDMQLLAMLAVVMLDMNRLRKEASVKGVHEPESADAQDLPSHSQSSSDYFTQRPSANRNPTSPSAIQSPGQSTTRGSWSSLSFLPFLGQPTGTPSPPKASTSVDTPITRKSSSLLTPAIMSTPSFTSLGHLPSSTRKVSLGGSGATLGRSWSQVVAKATTVKKEIICGLGQDKDEEHNVQSRSGDSLLDHTFVRQLVAHVRAYAELLDRWELAAQHAALLKFIPPDHRLPWEQSQSEGPGLSAINEASQCSVCRLPVADDSHTCTKCLHVAHDKCREPKKSEPCAATGCGCQCDATSPGPQASSS